jgi:hypothetical protein
VRKMARHHEPLMWSKTAGRDRAVPARCGSPWRLGQHRQRGHSCAKAALRAERPTVFPNRHVARGAARSAVAHSYSTRR